MFYEKKGTKVFYVIGMVLFSVIFFPGLLVMEIFQYFSLKRRSIRKFKRLGFKIVYPKTSEKKSKGNRNFLLIKDSITIHVSSDQILISLSTENNELGCFHHVHELNAGTRQDRVEIYHYEHSLKHDTPIDWSVDIPGRILSHLLTNISAIFSGGENMFIVEKLDE